MEKNSYFKVIVATVVTCLCFNLVSFGLILYHLNCKIMAAMKNAVIIAISILNNLIL